MSDSNRRSRWPALIVAIAAGVIAVAIWQFGSGTPEEAVAVRVPALDNAEQAGQKAFERTCAACHGRLAAGSDAGPPLVHPIYEPNHHGDLAFHRAVAQGVRAHHWPFGDMPPQPDVSRMEVDFIVRYVRALQRANGIE